uniref:Histone deacetylase 10 n=1 Tax=Gopherus evgoodei TaxID=1825980 RepID=A0A8C4YT21_9SAUR
MASGTALIYDDEMTSYKLLWDDPECDIEVPERLLSSYEQLKHYHLVERCIHVPVREGTEEEIMLVHSSEYLEVVKSTQTMNEEELQRVSENYDAVYFHPNTYRCAKLAVGATLQLVDSVMSGKVRNGMALVRPPGHHSQRNAANGFCVFNNVAIAAQYAKRRYGLQRILIVDWDVHHGQGIQYVFEEDPSVLYYSWHRYEHQQFWPLLRESDYDAVGQGKGKGFNLNVPWNKVGMGNSDYLAAFFHVLLPVAFEFVPELILVSSGYDSGIGDPEGQMNATPECFAHLTHFLMQLANGRLCAVLEGGYHLKSLSESVCMTVKTLLRDPLPQISGEMAPCLSAIESIQNVRGAHKPYWKCLMYEGNCSSDAERNNFFCAVLGFILPVAYSYQPDLVIIVIGPNRSLGVNGISLLTCLLQGLAESQILVVIQVRSEIKLVQSVAKALSGVSTPDFGAYAPASQENVLEIKRLRDQLQQEWKMLRCSGNTHIEN